MPFKWYLAHFLSMHVIAVMISSITFLVGLFSFSLAATMIANISKLRQHMCLLQPNSSYVQLIYRLSIFVLMFLTGPFQNGIMKTKMNMNLVKETMPNKPLKFSVFIFTLFTQYSYSYVAENFGDCSVTCGEGVRQRNVYCYAITGSSFEIVDNSLCNPLEEPPSEEICSLDPCGGVYEATAWSAVSYFTWELSFLMQEIFLILLTEHTSPIEFLHSTILQ